MSQHSRDERPHVELSQVQSPRDERPHVKLLSAATARKARGCSPLCVIGVMCLTIGFGLSTTGAAIVAGLSHLSRVPQTDPQAEGSTLSLASPLSPQPQPPSPPPPSLLSLVSQPPPPPPSQPRRSQPLPLPLPPQLADAPPLSASTAAALAEADAARMQGNSLFGESKYEEAVLKYTAALEKIGAAKQHAEEPWSLPPPPPLPSSLSPLPPAPSLRHPSLGSHLPHTSHSPPPSPSLVAHIRHHITSSPPPPQATSCPGPDCELVPINEASAFVFVKFHQVGGTSARGVIESQWKYDLAGRAGVGLKTGHGASLPLFRDWAAEGVVPPDVLASTLIRDPVEKVTCWRTL